MKNEDFALKLKTMKSKSFDLKDTPKEKIQLNRSFDFISLYKSAAESNVKLVEKFNSTPNVDRSKRECSPNKKKKKIKNEPVEISHIYIDGQSLTTPSGRSSPVQDYRATSTPYSNTKNQNKSPKVRSIMKNATVSDDTLEASNIDNVSHKPKKRNKSVSFMLEDNEEVAVKKTKSEESIRVPKKKDKLKSVRKEHDKSKFKKLKNDTQAEKENKTTNMEVDQNHNTSNKESKKRYNKPTAVSTEASPDSPASTSDNQPENHEKKKKLKKIKKRKKVEENIELTENESNNNDEPMEHKIKKLKKKKRHAKSVQQTDTTETEGEPAVKARKKDTKADVIAEDLENLSIGDNAHTLTNLLDEMTVVDKEKKKKNKHRRKKEKTQKTGSISSSETADLEKIEEGKEKIKWKKRKWNKEKKGSDVDDGSLTTSVIIENLPLKIMVTYKRLLTDHFGKLGLIKRIGIAEVYPTEEPKPVFTTTIYFYSEGAASKALEEDNTSFEGSRIRVKRPLPPTETTLVVRSYGELTEQSLSSVFTNAGKIRNIRHLLKGKKSLATAFIEFDGPDSVERAIKMAEDAKIGGKKIHVSKFELRGAKRKEKRAKTKSNAESENEGDSEDSNQ